MLKKKQAKMPFAVQIPVDELLITGNDLEVRQKLIDESEIESVFLRKPGDPFVPIIINDSPDEQESTAGIDGLIFIIGGRIVPCINCVESFAEKGWKYCF